MTRLHPDTELSLSGLYVDRYELAMAWAYWRDGKANDPAVFDYFFRTLPFGSGFALFAGSASLLHALSAFRFGPDEIAFLRNEGFDADFLDYLRDFVFHGSIWLPPEGEPVFPLEPVARVEGDLLETQVIETLLLNILNFQTLIATKAARCRIAANGRPISEFGLRRAQGMGGRWASRAAAIGGCASTSNLDAAHTYGLASAGTMSHSFIQSYDRELTAFRRYAATHGSATVLLLDTYDTLGSGLPNAIRVGHELAARGEKLAGVRLDSGDLAHMTRQTRQALDQAGLSQVRIVVSNQLDEFVIHSLLEQEAPIDLFGVGTALAAGLPDAALDGVYKLAVCGDRPRLKRSDSPAKATLPGRKTIARCSDDNGLFRADVIQLLSEPAPVQMVIPQNPGQPFALAGWRATPLLQPVMRDGRPLGSPPDVPTAAAHAIAQLKRLPPEHGRLHPSEPYPVGISPELDALRTQLLTQIPIAKS